MWFRRFRAKQLFSGRHGAVTGEMMRRAQRRQPREENGASRIAHRRPGSARRDATHAPLSRCTWLSASMSRRDLNFPTLGTLSSPFPSSVHCIAFTRCGATTSLSALLFSFPHLSPYSTRVYQLRACTCACASTCALESGSGTRTRTRIYIYLHADLADRYTRESS